MIDTIKRSKVESIKEQSNFLRGPIDAELSNDNSYFSQDGTQILKFHGSYQQKDRDLEKLKAKGEEPAYSMMLRTRSPGGYIPWQLYIALDNLSNQYGNQTLRATTRQGFQIHGILKQNMKTVIADIVRNMGSTVGACGDINRNVMAPPAPFKNRPEYEL
ncbi:MAG: sulfite reductase, ferredoxin dependent, partial [Pseudanabaena sp. SU_2_4]|nr:sulfite reductase, ferredoxin dependent [Pseudanabaena sp. SU_2_4]